jgi:hypothetical protein
MISLVVTGWLVIKHRREDMATQKEKLSIA